MEAPEPVVITVTKEVPADVPERFSRPCINANEPLPRGSSLSDMISHAGGISDDKYKCSDQIEELRNWNEEDTEVSNEQ